MSGDYWDAAIETLDREQLVALQTDRVRRQVERCYSQSELFRRKLEEARAVPADIRMLTDLAQVPVVTKEELRADQADAPPFGTFTVADRSLWREVHPSTGTTGAPVNTVWSAADVEAITDMTARTMWQFGVRPGHVVQNAFAYGLWVAGLSCHYASARLDATVIPVGASTATDRQIDYLVRAGSDVLLATPSYALHIAEEIAARGIDPRGLRVSIGCFGGEPGVGNAATRTRVERGLGVDAFDYYGLAEIGPTFASECRAKQGLHFAEDHVLVEAVDPVTMEPVPDGELGVLVFTHLTREASPLLRYWSNDYARLTLEPCACGRTHARALGGIVGRHDDLLIYKGAKFYPSQVEKVVRGIEALSDEFVVEISRPAPDAPLSDCLIVVESARPSEELRAELRSRLRAELGVTLELRVESPGALERTSFKSKRVREKPIAPPPSGR